MTHLKVIFANSAINGVTRFATGKTAYDLFKLKKAMQPVIEFQTEEEGKLIEKYDGEVLEGGAIVINDEEKRAEFEEEIKKVREIECDPEITPIHININTLPNITYAQIEALEGFVIFDE